MYLKLREAILNNDNSQYPDQSKLFQDIPALVEELGNWLESAPEFKQESTRVLVYKVLSNKRVASHPAAAELLLKGIREPSEYIRTVCLLGTKWAPVSMHNRVRVAQEEGLANPAFAESKRSLLTRELRLDSKPLPFAPKSPIESELWSALSSSALNRNAIVSLIDSHGADEVAMQIKGLLDRKPTVLGENERLHAYEALGMPAFIGSSVAFDLLSAGLSMSEPKAQIICARALGSVFHHDADLVLAAFTEYLRCEHPNKDVDLVIFEKLLPGKHEIRDEIAEAAAAHLGLFPSDKNHSAYCAFVMLAGMPTAEAISRFRQASDADIIRSIATGISLVPGRIPRLEGTPEIDFQELRAYTISLITDEDPEIRAAGLRAVWGCLGTNPHARTVDQGARNKEIIVAVKRIKAMKNTQNAQTTIQLIELSFDESGFLKSKEEIRESLTSLERD